MVGWLAGFNSMETLISLNLCDKSDQIRRKPAAQPTGTMAQSNTPILQVLVRILSSR